MNIKMTMAASVLALAGFFPTAQAEPAIVLSSPVVELVAIAKSAELGLSDEQKAKLAAWIAEAPAKRKAVENEQIRLRAELRAAILDGKPADERQALIDKIASNEAQLLTMRSKCTDFLRGLLTAEQFDKVVAAYKAK